LLRKFANDTPYMVVYRRQEEDMPMTSEETPWSPSLLKFIEQDNKTYEDEIKKNRD